MFNSPRRHPLQTFRFWFFTLGAVAVTVAWRLELLPFELAMWDISRPAEDVFVAVDPTTDADTWGGSQTEVSGSTDESPFFTAADESSSSDINPFAAEQMAAPSAPRPRTDGPAARQVAATSLPLSVSPTTELPELVQADSPGAATDDWWGASAASADNEGSGPRPATPAGPATPDSAEIVKVASREFASPTGDSPVVIPAAASSLAGSYDFSQIDALIQSARSEGEVEAHRELSRLYWQRPELRPELQDRLDQLARRIYFMPQPHYMDPYVVQPGDLLQNVARNYEISWQYLAKLNRVHPQKVRAGQELKVIKGPFSAIVDLSDYELTIHAHGYYVARFPVGVGKDGSTPIGEMTVQEKLQDPTYYGPDGVVAHDDPENPLGEHWIDIGNSFGIHGTTEPDSIGQSLSRGCVRLRNEDVAVVYDLLTIGSSVQIRE